MANATVDIKTRDGVCDCFLARPNNDSAGRPATEAHRVIKGGVLLYMDAFGLRPYLEEMAQKLADRGYLTLVPNLFYRSKRSPVFDIQFPLTMEARQEAVKQIMPLAMALTPDQAMRDAQAFVDFLGQQLSKSPPSAAPQSAKKIAATGYCMGGTLAIRTAAAYPDRIVAAASFHAGRLVQDAEDSPHRLLKKIRAELYFGHADNDQSMPPEQIAQFELALKESGLTYKSELYTGAMHGFTMADLPAGNPQALAKHWDRLFDLLERNL